MTDIKFKLITKNNYQDLLVQDVIFDDEGNKFLIVSEIGGMAKYITNCHSFHTNYAGRKHFFKGDDDTIFYYRSLAYGDKKIYLDDRS